MMICSLSCLLLLADTLWIAREVSSDDLLCWVSRKFVSFFPSISNPEEPERLAAKFDRRNAIPAEYNTLRPRQCVTCTGWGLGQHKSNCQCPSWLLKFALPVDMQRIPPGSIGMVSGLGAGFNMFQGRIPAFGRHCLNHWRSGTTPLPPDL